jgi:hypothetical protein
MSPTVEIQLSGTISEGTDPRRWLTLAVVVLAGFIAFWTLPLTTVTSRRSRVIGEPHTRRCNGSWPATHSRSV